MRQEVTLAAAVRATIDGIRSMPDDWTLIGHYSNDSAVRREAAAVMLGQARRLADELERIEPASAARMLRDRRDLIANLDPHRHHLGAWPHVAVMIADGAVYAVVDGVLCQSTRSSD
jgi:hypothetical protein